MDVSTKPMMDAPALREITLKNWGGGGTIDWSNPDNVQVFGQVTHGVTLVAVSPVAIVLKFKGYTYNPGSRNSMLRGYTKAETVTYLIDQGTYNETCTRARCYPVIGWDTRHSR